MQSLLAEGVALLKTGNLEQASQRLQQHLQQNPAAVDAYYFLAIIAFKQGQAASALKCLETALKYNPNDLRCLSNLASIHGHLGNAAAGIAAYQKCISLDPKNATFHYGLGNFYILTEDAAEAAASYQRAISLQPQWEEVYFSLARLYQYQNHYQQAETLYRDLLNQGSRNLQVPIQLIHNLEHQGKKQEALSIINNALAVHSNCPQLYFELTRIDSTAATADMQRKVEDLATQSLSEMDSFYVHTVLARCHKQQQHYSLELEHLRQGREPFVKATNFKIKNDFYFEYLAQRKPLQNVELVAEEAIVKFLANCRPIFIVGTPRSGSTLVENVICASKEAPQKGEEVGAFISAMAASAGRGNLDLNVLANHVLKIYHSIGLAQEHKVFTDKSLDNILFIDILLAIFPKARIVYCQRDPIASAVSILQNVMPALSWAHNLDEILAYIDLCLKKADLWQARFEDSMYILRHETFVSAPKEESQKLFNFMELPWDESCLEFQDKKTISRTSSALQIRAGIEAKGSSSRQRYQASFEPYFSQYPWLKASE